MEIRDLIPWNRERRSAPATPREGDDPFVTLRRDMNRVLEDFWSRFERPFSGGDGALTAVGPTQMSPRPTRPWRFPWSCRVSTTMTWR